MAAAVPKRSSRPTRVMPSEGFSAGVMLKPVACEIAATTASVIAAVPPRTITRSGS